MTAAPFFREKYLNLLPTVKASLGIAEGGRFRSYVLVALPTGEANALQKRKDQLRLKDRAEQRSTDAFKEMDKNSEHISLYPETTAQ
jgi:hypothetical protein